MSLEEKRFTNGFFSCYFCFAWQHSPRIFECSRRMLSKNHLHVYVFREKKLYLFFFFRDFCFAWQHSPRIFEEYAVSPMYMFFWDSVWGHCPFVYIYFDFFVFLGGTLSSHAHSIGKSLRPPMHSAGMSYVWDVYIIYVKALYMLGFITM